MAASRVTNHNGRTNGKGGVLGSKHNDRNFDVERADNIDGSRCADNVYWTFAKAKVKETDKDGNVTERDPKNFDEQEQAVYIAQFSKYLDSRNAKAIEGRHKNRVQTMEQFRRNRKACPEETIFSVGNTQNPCDPAVLRAIYEEYMVWYQATFPNVLMLNAAMHLDEASPHIQERKVWTAHEGGMLIINQEKAFAEMGIERPDTSKPVGRFNNAKMTYTKMCRDKQIEIAKAHGIEIEDKPREPSKSGLSMNEYKKQKIQEDIAVLQEQEKELAERFTGYDSCNIELEQIKADMKPSKLQKDKSVISTDKLNGLIELAEQGIAATAAAAQAQKKMKTMIPKNQHEKAVTDLVYKNNELMNNNRTLQAENDKLKRFRDKAIERGLYDAVAAPENISEKQAQTLKKREVKER